jgi:hypothetical protein
MEGARHRIRALAVAVVIGLVGALSASAEARISPGPVVDIQSAAWLAPDGQSMTVQVLASCPERWTILEAGVTVSQPQASGQASFSFPCIGSLRMFSVVVPSIGGTFELGDALVSASVTIKRGKTERAQDSEVVLVQPAVFVELANTARLESGGGAVLIDIAVACPVGATGQESYVNISQGQTSGNGTYLPICDGRQHTFTVRVEASRGAYQPGSAQALTFANIEHEGIGTAGVDDGPIQIVT